MNLKIDFSTSVKNYVSKYIEAPNSFASPDLVYGNSRLCSFLEKHAMCVAQRFLDFGRLALYILS